MLKYIVASCYLIQRKCKITMKRPEKESTEITAHQTTALIPLVLFSVFLRVIQTGDIGMIVLYRLKSIKF